MERILVGMTPRNGSFAALSRATALAKRIPARIFVLFVTEPGRNTVLPVAEIEARRRLRFMVERAQQEGVAIEWFVAEGSYEEEVVRFAVESKISLLVLEVSDGEDRQAEREAQSLQQILHRVSCRVELVSPRKDEPAT